MPAYLKVGDLEAAAEAHRVGYVANRQATLSE
jgi:hypothetical protein